MSARPTKKPSSAVLSGECCWSASSSKLAPTAAPTDPAIRVSQNDVRELPKECARYAPKAPRSASSDTWTTEELSKLSCRSRPSRAATADKKNEPRSFAGDRADRHGGRVGTGAAATIGRERRRGEMAAASEGRPSTVHCLDGRGPNPPKPLTANQAEGTHPCPRPAAPLRVGAPSWPSTARVGAAGHAVCNKRGRPASPAHRRQGPRVVPQASQSSLRLCTLRGGTRPRPGPCRTGRSSATTPGPARPAQGSGGGRRSIHTHTSRGERSTRCGLRAPQRAWVSPGRAVHGRTPIAEAAGQELARHSLLARCLPPCARRAESLGSLSAVFAAPCAHKRRRVAGLVGGSAGSPAFGGSRNRAAALLRATSTCPLPRQRWPQEQPGREGVRRATLRESSARPSFRLSTAGTAAPRPQPKRTPWRQQQRPSTTKPLRGRQRQSSTARGPKSFVATCLRSTGGRGP